MAGCGKKPKKKGIIQKVKEDPMISKQLDRRDKSKDQGLNL